MAQNALANHPCNPKSARLAAFDKIGNGFSFTYSQMTAQQFKQLNVYCRHLYFMKIGHEINCCVFKSRECTKQERALAKKTQLLSRLHIVIFCLYKGQV